MKNCDRYRKFYWLELVDKNEMDCDDRVCYLNPNRTPNECRTPVLFESRKEARIGKKNIEYNWKWGYLIPNMYDPKRHKVVIVQVEHACDDDLFAQRIR